MFNSNYFVYITTNPKRTTFYIGVTNDLPRRLIKHFQNSGNPQTFAGKYYCYKLIYFERHTSSEHAISREKQLKGWNRSKKEALIKSQNPEFRFLITWLWMRRDNDFLLVKKYFTPIIYHLLYGHLEPGERSIAYRPVKSIF